MEKLKMIPAIWTGMYNDLPLHEAFSMLNDFGWRAFEISTEHLIAIETSDDPDKLIDNALCCLSNLDLLAPQAHAYLQADVASSDAKKREQDIKRLLTHINIASRLNVSNVVMHPGGRLFEARAEQKEITKLNIEAFRRLGDFAEEHGVSIGMENLIFKGNSTPSELLELLELIDHPAIGVTLDTSHAHMSSLNVAQFVRELGPNLVSTHISDNNSTGDQHLTPGGGSINWPEAMTAFREIEYDGLLNLEIPGERHSDAELRKLKTRYALEVANWLVEIAKSET